MGRGAALGASVVCLIVAGGIWQVSRDARVPIPTSYDYMEGVYAATADAASHGARLYREVFVSQPPILILAIRASFAILGTSLAAARSTIVLASAIWLIAILALLWIRGSVWGGSLAVCLLLGSSFFLAHAHTVEMEVPSEALGFVAVALAAWGVRTPGLVWWASAGALAALAAMTKLTGVLCMIPIAGAAVSAPRATWPQRWAGIAAGGLLVVVALLPLIATTGFRDQVFTFHAAVARAVRESHRGHAATVARFLAGQWPLSATAALGFWWSLRRGDWLERAFIAWLIAGCGLLVAITPLWDHHLMLLVSPLAFLAGTAVKQVESWIPRLNRVWRLGTAVVLAIAAMTYILVGASAVPPPAPSADLAMVVDRISHTVPAERRVLTDDPMVAFLARRPLAGGAPLIDPGVAMIWAGEITEARLEAALRETDTDAVVFWRGTFRDYFPRLEPLAVALFPVAVQAPGGRLLLLKR